METLTTICVFLVMCGTGPTNAYSIPEICNHGDNATVLFEKLPTDRRKSMEIYFSGFTQKLHVIHMIIMEPNTTNENYIQISRHYSGRIKDINMNNGCLTFLLLNVNFMDSGNYTVFEGSLEKGKRSILVTRRILSGQVSKSMILPFTCNNTNTSSITIGKNHVFDHADYIVYDVARKSCTYTNVSKNLINRIDSCFLNNTSFNLILRELTWQDKGAYTAWDDQGLLLDSLFAGSRDNDLSSPRSTYMPDSSSHEDQYDNDLSSPRSTYMPDSSSHEDQYGKYIWLLVSTVINVLVLACLAIIAVRKLRHRKGKKTKEEEITCFDQDLRMFQADNTALQSDDDDDETNYEEPRSNDMELTAFLEPVSQPVNVYERVHPYENQENNMYRFLPPENII